MKKITKIIAVLLSITLMAICFTACVKSSEKEPIKPVNPNDFRVTAYIICADEKNIPTFDFSHFSQVTDFILFSAATFDEQGNVKVNDNLSLWVDAIKNAAVDNKTARFYINILGPDGNTTSDDWNKQMSAKGDSHAKAFKSGVLEQNIKDVLEKYEFDGVFFDYEYPLKNKHWKAFDNFLISLDKVLGDEYKIGSSIASWNLKQSKKAIDVIDLATIMSYDLWDDEGDHASVQLAKDDIEKVRKAGYDMSKVDLGVPFYARPTTHEAFWYDYKTYIEDIDQKGFYVDKGLKEDGTEKTGLTFKFNSPEMIKEKTDLALEQGLGGIMIWHYSCDVPSNDDRSLFNAIDNQKQLAIDNAQNK